VFILDLSSRADSQTGLNATSRWWRSICWPIVVALVVLGLGLALNRQFATGSSLIRWVPAEFVSRASAILSAGAVVAIVGTGILRKRTSQLELDETDAPTAPVRVVSPVRIAVPSVPTVVGWSLALCLPLLLTGQAWHSFDFPTHVFFASHYQRDWWSLWEPRWFDGFNVASYPPLTHQLAALLGWLVGNELAVNLLITATVVVFPIAVYAFARDLLTISEARIAAALAAATPSVFLCGFAFGQLPTLFALDASLLAATTLGRYVRFGSKPQLAIFIGLVGVVAAAHHATAIFLLPPLLGTVALISVLNARCRVSDVARVAAAAVGAAAVVLLVILPFWVWHAFEYVAQVPIDHQSRHDFIQDLVAQDLFFWAEHGILVAALPLSIGLARRRPHLNVPVITLAVFLLVVGLGGTTGLPRILFGDQWAWLTYDRFGLWADVPLLLLLAQAVKPLVAMKREGARYGVAVWRALLGTLGCYSILAAMVPALVQSEPTPIDPRPVVAFLNASAHQGWRYLTLGLGDQFGLISAQVSASTPDGDYFTARRLPELTSSGIATLDFSLLWDPQARVLRGVLENPAPYGLRWVFTEDPAYARILGEADWSRSDTLADGVQVWEPNQRVPAIVDPVHQTTALAIWWGTTPLATLIGTIALGTRRWLKKTDRVRSRARRKAELASSDSARCLGGFLGGLALILGAKPEGGYDGKYRDD
jgi:hypothetical protein